jgi:hypothetical protein
MGGSPHVRVGGAEWNRFCGHPVASLGKEPVMALYMDVHSLDSGVKLAVVANAHAADLATQDAHGVHYLRYWVDEGNGKIFCLVDAPSAEDANTVHREAHGLVADEIYEVSEGV